ncbi:MAG: YciI family protein [Alphaproteobacteria bacterium]|nr:YciI family protein [Alphaproteobacteria bacterium]MBL6936637.1 YciI family protein [Alphaproteobacteria bacterium]MBL7097406.1 YciI family protein [Alphaproteobacteria bacterium]
MRFMILMIPEVYQREVPENFVPPADAIERMGKFNQSMAEAGILGDLNGLHPPSKGARITFKTGKPVVTDGPFAEAREVLGGYWFIDVPSREAAIEWMKKCPAEKGDIIEIRQIFGPDEFPETP